MNDLQLTKFTALKASFVTCPITYARELTANVDSLVKRLHKMAYKPQPVLRIYIPKAGSTKRRALGIPALEDKLVQAALVKILQTI